MAFRSVLIRLNSISIKAIGPINATCFSGAIGSDTQGENLSKRLKRAKIETYLQKVELPTAKAVSLVTQGRVAF